MASRSEGLEVSLIQDLGRQISRAVSVEMLLEQIHNGLCLIAPVHETRIVALEAPTVWKEWITGSETAGVRTLGVCLAPDSRGIAEAFDAQNPEAGFLWVAAQDSRLQDVMRLITPHVHTALMLQTTLKRTRHSNSRKRKLLQALLHDRDEERRRIARELHDDLGQSLVSIRLNLKWVEDRITTAAGMAEAVKELVSTREAIGVVLGKIRDVSHTLYPSILDTLGLSAAIKELVHHATKRSGIETVCSEQGEQTALSKEAAVALYRSCQETLNNAISHSGASRIVVTVAYHPAEVHITVDDNGRGFDPRSLRAPGDRIMSNGFWSIRQRMTDLGGAFSVRTSKGHGTVVEVIVPVKETNVQCKPTR